MDGRHPGGSVGELLTVQAKVGNYRYGGSDRIRSVTAFFDPCHYLVDALVRLIGPEARPVLQIVGGGEVSREIKAQVYLR